MLGTVMGVMVVLLRLMHLMQLLQKKQLRSGQLLLNLMVLQ